MRYRRPLRRGPARLEAAIVAEVEALAEGRIEARDFERAREQFLARYALESESVTDVAHQLGYFETIGSHALWLALPARLSKVTAADVARLARARLDARHRTVGTLVP
jgi:predicted Zn-dependent peptidase